MTNHAPVLGPSEPGMFFRQTKAGLKPGLSSRTTSTFVIFKIPDLPFGKLAAAAVTKAYWQVCKIVYYSRISPLVFYED
jgi:hypothetical protein